MDPHDPAEVVLQPSKTAWAHNLRELHGSFQLSKRASDALDHSQKVVTWLFRATLDPSQKVVTQLVNATLDHSQKALTQQKPNLVHFFICAVFHRNVPPSDFKAHGTSLEKLVREGSLSTTSFAHVAPPQQVPTPK